VCSDLVIKGYKLATLPICRINKKWFWSKIKKKHTSVEYEKPTSALQTCLQQQLCCNCGPTVHCHFWYRVHGSVQSCHFLLPVNVCGVLSSIPTWRVSSWHQTVTKAPACPFIWYCRAASHSSKLASTRWWKRLYSKDFQHSDSKTVAVGNELHTEYDVIFIKYNFT